MSPRCRYSDESERLAHGKRRRRSGDIEIDPIIFIQRKTPIIQNCELKLKRAWIDVASK